MTSYIALLRGVNVGGITVKSAELRELFDGLGFEGVRTVLASGNVVFETTKREAHAALKRRIERALADRFGYDAWIVLVTRAELERAIDAFPFDADDARRQPWVIFASEPAVVDELLEAARCRPRRRPARGGRRRALLEPGEGHDRADPLRQADRQGEVQAGDDEPQPAHAAEDPRLIA